MNEITKALKPQILQITNFSKFFQVPFLIYWEFVLGTVAAATATTKVLTAFILYPDLRRAGTEK